MKKIILLITVILLSHVMVGAQTDTILVKKADVVKLPFVNLEKERVVGAVDVIDGSEILHSGEYNARTALAGLAAGMYVFKGANQPGANWASLSIRGLSRGGRSDGPMVVVDGVPNRDLSDLPVESIKSIQILKDVTAKMLYGSSAANGVVLVTTKRGYVSKRKLSFSVEGGIKVPVALPEFLDAATYAERYDQARENDGLSPLHANPGEYEKYKSGMYPRTYPNTNYYDMFLKQNSNYQRVNSILEGGDSKTKYFLNMEYVRETGLEKVGNNNTYNLINLVSNLDYEVNNVISVSLDISTKLGTRNSARLGAGSMFSALSSQRPNEYPMFVTKDGSVNIDSLGFKQGYSNVYGDLTRWGYRDSKEFRGQTTLGMKFDLNDYVKGLTGGVSLGFDNYRSITTGKNLQYQTFAVINEDSITAIGDNVPSGNKVKISDNFFRNIAGTAYVDYIRSFGKHQLTTNLVYTARKLAYKATSTYSGGNRQDDKNTNLGLRVNYMYDNKYVVEGTSSYMGSDKFAPGKRFGLFGGVGAGWILSNEGFASDLSFVDYLKIKGSFGVMGYDRFNPGNSFDYYEYIDQYQTAGSVRLGENNSGPTLYGTKLTSKGNPDLTFEKSRDLNVGLEATLFKNLSFEFNYFNEYRYDMPATLNSVIPAYLASVSPVGNYEELTNTGIDFSLKYQKTVGEFQYSLGGNFMSTYSKWDRLDEISEYDNLLRTGKAADAIFGWVFDGFYKDPTDIDSYGVTSAYGTILPGDIKLMNIVNDKNDNIIDGNDRQVIGNSFPRINYALNLNLKYKGFELYALGQGVAGLDKVLTNKYYMPYGDRKYSVQVLRDNYPRLTSLNSGHSYRTSSYWMKDGSYFKLRVLELSYILPDRLAKEISAEKVRFFVKGTDLFSISKITELDPEDINAGVTKYPMFTTYSLGLKVTF